MISLGMSALGSTVRRAGVFRAGSFASRGGPLSEGDVQGTRVTCQWHGADFDLKTGAVLGPPVQKSVPSFKVTVEGDDIKVEV